MEGAAGRDPALRHPPPLTLHYLYPMPYAIKELFYTLQGEGAQTAPKFAVVGS